MLTGKGSYESKVLILLHCLSNVKINKYFDWKPRFNGVYLRDIIPRIKDWVYVTNLYEKQSIGKHCISSTLILLELKIFVKKY